MPLRYVAGVSLPRSGHHLMERLLARYFDRDGDAGFRYCEFYAPEIDCCRDFPCSRDGVTFSKNHALDDASSLPADVPQLVQYRAFLPAVISDFELWLREGNPDTAAGFLCFAWQRASMWGRFVARWVDADPIGERLIISYEDLTSDPVVCLTRAIDFFGGEVDEQVVRDIVCSEEAQTVTKAGDVWTPNAGVMNRRRIEEFRFHDQAVFRRIQARADEVRRAWR